MTVFVLTRTENFGEERRIIEGVYSDKAKAESERQAILAKFKDYPKFCTDTEISQHEVIG